jgi:hypothetical protein
MFHEAEVVLPSEVTMGSIRAQVYDEVTHDQFRCEGINLVDERR